jgi:hypothetical protein
MSDAREVLNQLLWGKELNNESPVVIGTAQQADEQMEAFDTWNDQHPSEVVDTKSGQVISPDWTKEIGKLPRTPAIYETKFNLDSVVRYDSSFTAAGTSAVIQIPTTIPQGKYAFLDELLVAQISGAGSSPSGYLTDQNISQLFAILTPDGSTFGAAYKSGRNIVPGGIQLTLTLNSLVAAATYVVGLQYKLRTRIDVPIISLSDYSERTSDTLTFDDGNEAGTPLIGRQELPGGPYDDSGYDGV